MSKQSTETKTQSQAIPLPCLSLAVDKVQLPEVETVTVKRKGESGEILQEHEKNTEVHFSSSLKAERVPSVEMAKALGLDNQPYSTVSMKLYENDSHKLLLDIKSTYFDTETRTKTEYYNHHWVPEGQRTPYGPVEPGYMESDEREVSEEIEVQKSESKEKLAVTQPRFNELYLSLINAKSSNNRDAVLSHLHKKHSAQCSTAQQWIKGRLAEAAEQAREEAKRATSVFEGISLPEIP